jgi:hypothetical protein
MATIFSFGQYGIVTPYESTIMSYSMALVLVVTTVTTSTILIAQEPSTKTVPRLLSDGIVDVYTGITTATRTDIALAARGAILVT